MPKLILTFLCGVQLALFAAAPVVEYVTISRRPDSMLVDIEYKVTDADGDKMSISVTGVDRQGNRVVSMETLGGDGADGEPVESGVHTMTWDAGADWPGNVTDEFEVRLTANDAVGKKYLIIDVSEGPDATRYPVEYRDDIVDSFDDARGKKIHLVRLDAGTFTMGSPINETGRYTDETQHDVVLTQPFYVGMFEITQYQWAAVMGDYPSRYQNANSFFNPVEQVEWTTVRGGEWPGGSKLPSSESFIGTLRKRTGILFDLPTEARWEYACRGETTKALNNDTNLIDTSIDPNLNTLGRYAGNGNYPAQAGRYLPNQWELYDMHGNVAEWVLDWAGDYQSGLPNPAGPATGNARIARGGSHGKIARWCRSAARNYTLGVDTRDSNIGFRIIAPDYVELPPVPTN